MAKKRIDCVAVIRFSFDDKGSKKRNQAVAEAIVDEGIFAVDKVIELAVNVNMKPQFVDDDGHDTPHASEAKLGHGYRVRGKGKIEVVPAYMVEVNG